MRMSPLVARGRVIAAARMLAGLDQHQLAAAAGLSASTISKIEQGRKNVRRTPCGPCHGRWRPWA
jgi:transcriptional regulator with XRE-family HTH domain